MNLKKSCQGQKIRSGVVQLLDSPLKVRGQARVNRKDLGLMLLDKGTWYYFKYISETCITIRQHYGRNGTTVRLHIHFKSQFESLVMEQIKPNLTYSSGTKEEIHRCMNFLMNWIISCSCGTATASKI